MRKLAKNTKGAVTVFVSLLLIPAILVSGTAVDLARIHTARSIVQDANQLAANSLLTQYNAMLQDIYGLYAVMEDDPILGELLNEYIQVAILGENWQDRSLGTFQLFYGSDAQSVSATPASGKNLRSVAVLRRQIEEYAKFRAPVIIINELLERLDSFNKLKADSDAIEKKMEIDDEIEEIDKLYDQIFDLINDINRYQAAESSAFESVNKFLSQIHDELVNLRNTRDDWTNAFDDEEMGLASEYEAKYKDIQENIKSLIVGGQVKSGWMPGGEGGNGGWTSSYRSNGLNKSIGDAKTELEKYKKMLADLVKKCEQADKKKQDLSKKVDELEATLKSGACSKELSDGMTTPNADGKSVIDGYRDLLKYELTPMAEAMKSTDEAHINYVVSMLDDIAYGHVSGTTIGSPMISRENLKSLANIAGFDVDLHVRNRTISPQMEDTLFPLAALSSYAYDTPDGFKRFEDSAFDSTHNAEFYEALKELYGSDSGKTKKKDAKKTVTKLFEKAQELFKGFTNDPMGAKYYRTGVGGNSGSFGTDGDWSKENVAKDKAKEALNDSLISKLGDLSGSAADKLLLLTYDTEMFSNYATTPGALSMSGVPLGTDVNYYFQSEQEFLYNGNLYSADANLSAVSGLLFLVRFVFNYVASFTIPDVNNTVNSIKAAMSFTGPFSILIGELARLAFVLAESAIDVGSLRIGKRIPLIKTKDTWTFSVSGLVNAAKDGLVDISDSLTDSLTAKEDESGLSYKDYMCLFLLMVDGDDLAKRTADLISLNMTNKENGFNANEANMSSATLFDMAKAHTDFTMTTAVDLRMLFLSMSFAQKGANGVVPPKTMPVIVTDYRGY